jgi:type IX secretion system PorP/SprF family membrane protein
MMKNSIKIYFTYSLLLCLSPGALFGQQESNFSVFSGDLYMFNPAASGVSNIGSASIGTRLQWLASAAAPSTIYMNVHGQIKTNRTTNAVLQEFNKEKKKGFETVKRTVGAVKHTTGFKAMNDRIGPFSKTSLQGSYAYHLPLTKKTNLSFGLGFGYTNLGIDTRKVRVENQTDDLYNEFLTGSNGINMLDASAGISIYGKKTLVGISTTQLFANNFKANSFILENGFNRHWNVYISHLLFEKNDITVEPIIMYRSVKGAPKSIDFGTKFTYQNNVSVGLMYRTGNTLGLQFGINFAKIFNLSYAFEHYFSGNKSSLRNTNEIKLSYIFGSKRNISKEIKEQKKINDDELAPPVPKSL